MTENEANWEEGGGIFFDSEGDVDTLRRKHVGFPAADFLPGGQTTPGPPDDDGN